MNINGSYFDSTNERTINYKITNENIKLINIHYNAPTTSEEIVNNRKEKYLNNKEISICSYYNRDFTDNILSLEFLIDKKADLNVINNYLHNTERLEILELSKFYNVKYINTKRISNYKNFYTILVSFYFNVDTMPYNILLENNIVKELETANKVRHFYVSVKNNNNSVFKILVSDDKLDNKYTPVVDIDLNITTLQIDTINNIYMADNKNLLDVNNYTNINTYKKFINSIANLNALGGFKTNIKAIHNADEQVLFYFVAEKLY